MISEALGKVFGSKQDRDVKKMLPFVAAVNELERRIIFDQSGATGVVDLGLFKKAFGGISPAPPYDPDIDMDSDLAIGVLDLGLFKKAFGFPPGPSGLACAGVVIPCP